MPLEFMPIPTIADNKKDLFFSLLAEWRWDKEEPKRELGENVALSVRCCKDGGKQGH